MTLASGIVTLALAGLPSGLRWPATEGWHGPAARLDTSPKRVTWGRGEWLLVLEVGGEATVGMPGATETYDGTTCRAWLDFRAAMADPLTWAPSVEQQKYWTRRLVRSARVLVRPGS
jgi:hypothetical protein